MLWVAIFNGYPVLYPDSQSYLWGSVSLQPPIQRSIICSRFIRFTSLGISPWLVIFAQVATVIFVLHAVFKYIIRQHAVFSTEGPILFLGLAAFLAPGTSLPWFAGQLMPDVFTGICFLCLFLLLYDSKFSLEQRVLASIVLAVAVGRDPFLLTGYSC